MEIQLAALHHLRVIQDQYVNPSGRKSRADVNPAGKAFMDTGYGQTIDEDSRPNEPARLAALAEALDPFSTRRLTPLLDERALPRVLEVGPGAGTIAHWMTHRYELGELVLLDYDPEVLDRLSGLDARQVTANITDPDLPQPGRFDLIHARLVLMHLPARLYVVQRLASWLAPGGWLVISDMVDSAGFCQDPAVARAVQAMKAASARAIGTDRQWGLSFPEPLHGVGLNDIGLAFDTPILTGGADCGFATWLSMTLNRLRVHVLDTGMITAEQLRAAQHRLSTPGPKTAAPLTLVTMWGQAPRASSSSAR
jgi:SAM-dependent methyltransferase